MHEKLKNALYDFMKGYVCVLKNPITKIEDINEKNITKKARNQYDNDSYFKMIVDLGMVNIEAIIDENLDSAGVIVRK